VDAELGGRASEIEGVELSAEGGLDHRGELLGDAKAEATVGGELGLDLGAGIELLRAADGDLGSALLEVVLERGGEAALLRGGIVQVGTERVKPGGLAAIGGATSVALTVWASSGC
jgi:hypothetical protein